MKYKLYNEDIQINKVDDILRARGIENVEEWENASWEQINTPFAFGARVYKAVDLLAEAVRNCWRVCVIVDADADGFTSSAVILNFLYKLYNWNYSKEKCQDKLTYVLHSGKGHGLKDTYDKILKDVQLVIIPDAASNDVEELKKLSKRGIKVLVMDHHHTDETYEDENVIVINNQISEYPNKDLSGAGVTWQICRAYDEIYGLDFSNDLIDLAALGILSDMEPYTSIENRAIIRMGLENIKNPFMYYMCDKNKFSIDKRGGINYMSMAFYVTPFLNATVRSGIMEEKELIFKSMLQMYAFDKIPSEKRGHKEEMVDLVEEAVRVIGNVKARQTRLQDATMDLLEKKIEEEDMLKNDILIFKCQPGEVEKNLAGLVANKLMAKYQRPALVLIYSKTKDDEEPFYRGSARNYGLSEIEDLRQTCEDSGFFELAQGHSSAFGTSIAASRIDEFQDWFNENFDEASSEPTYIVDFIWNQNQVNPQMILDVASKKEWWGQDLQEPSFCLKDIPIGVNNVQLLSRDKNPTIKIHLDCGVDVMKFRSSEKEYMKLTEPNTTITIIGTANKNEWCGRVTAQIMCDSYETKQQWIF